MAVAHISEVPYLRGSPFFEQPTFMVRLSLNFPYCNLVGGCARGVAATLNLEV